MIKFNFDIYIQKTALFYYALSQLMFLSFIQSMFHFFSFMYRFAIYHNTRFFLLFPYNFQGKFHGYSGGTTMLLYLYYVCLPLYVPCKSNSYKNTQLIMSLPKFAGDVMFVPCPSFCLSVCHTFSDTTATNFIKHDRYR